MTSPYSQDQFLQLRQIYRKRLLNSLALSAVIATLLAGCNQQKSVSPTGPSSNPSVSSSSTATTTTPNADPNEPVEAVFYKDVEQCKEDVAAEQQKYETLLASYQKGDITEEPTAPVITVEDCGPQMQAALEEHNRTAPQYSTLEQCEANGAECETTTNNTQTYYRPTYGGSYFYPYRTPSFFFFNYGGTNHRVYQPYPVYQSSIPGNVVTSTGQTVSQSTSGRVTVPRYTNFSTPSNSGNRSTTTNRTPSTTPSTGTSTTTPRRSPSTPSVSTPQRPTTSPARGSVNGRGSSGFGSTFKGTGRGGK
ncbi:MAG: hypothetical protein AAGD25_17935 [Cyanobacteria bacterium P01_F01_bin.150]